MKYSFMLLRPVYVSVFLLSFALMGSQYANAAEAGSHRIPVMIVGLSHFVAHADLHNSKFVDVMSPEHQKQIEQVVRDLARFKPTKVMIEQPYGDAKIVQQYQEYLNGTYKLGANEVYQIGFRLATLSGNKSIYPIDTNTDFPFDYDGLVASAKLHNQTAILAASEAHIVPLLKRSDYLEQHGTILELLRYINTPEALDMNASLYMYMDRVGGGKDYAGADLVAYWYARNLHIYANIMRSVDSPGDRVVVLMGQGHVPQLKEYMRLSPDLELVDPELYLK
ncbi:MAG: DUF5694 domain-containing protein [Gammaproteobacteria bacterium]